LVLLDGCCGLRRISVVVDLALYATPGGIFRSIVTITGFVAWFTGCNVGAPDAVAADRNPAGVGASVTVVIVAIIAGFITIKRAITALLDTTLVVTDHWTIVGCRIALLHAGFDVAIPTTAADAFIDASISIVHVAIVTGFPDLLDAIVTSRRPTKGCTAIVFVAVAIIADFVIAVVLG
tara:strand:+ start:26 stop:562 length:537 start_codon:yes stop_codon:yes gene_type:complete